MATMNSNCTSEYKPLMAWPEAGQLPPKLLEAVSAEEWVTSERIWIRVRAVFKFKDGLETEVVVRPAYTALGRCVWPKKPVAYVPVLNANKENPATSVEWGDAEPFYEVSGARVNATHWYPCPEPLPPGTPLTMTVTNDAGEFNRIYFDENEMDSTRGGGN